MRRIFYTPPIGQAKFEQEQTRQDKNSQAFLVVIFCLAVIELVAQIVMKL